MCLRSFQVAFKEPLTYSFHRNGTLKEYIRGGGPGGSSKEDLVNRIAKILTPPAPAESGAQPTTSSSAGRTLNQGPATPASQAPASTRNSVTDDLYDDYDDVPAPVSSSAPTGSSGQPQQSPQVQALLAERAKRLEADKKAKAKAEKDARAKARQEANEAHEGQSSNANPAGKSYAEEIRQKKIQAAEERKRILKRIEDDKQERKEREAQERQARLLLSATQDGEGPSYQAPPIPLPRIQGGAKGGDRCNLQIRLFDGSTIRTQFKSDATLSKDVRDWIDEDRTDGDAPYTFRIVLTPLPNKAIEPAEESESLLSLGLAPSATLVLVPSKHALAYTRSNGFIWQTLAYILGIFGAGYGLITSVFGGFTGMFSGRGGNRQEGIAMQNLASGRSASRIRGFQNADDQRRDAQLYNGNSVGLP